MAIYTRFGSEVQLLTARLVPVWIERLPGEIKWHYAEKKPSKRTEAIDAMPCWHVTAKDKKSGRMICDGKLISANEFRADDGAAEIHDTMQKINPDHRDRFMEWAQGRMEAAAFGPVDKKMIA